MLRYRVLSLVSGQEIIFQDVYMNVHRSFKYERFRIVYINLGFYYFTLVSHPPKNGRMISQGNDFIGIPGVF